MQDIDFDELDRAVSSAINPSSEPSEKPAERETPSSDVPPLVVPARSQITSPVAKRSSGRFMDVVHPSSDMRSSTPVKPLVVSPTPIAPKAEPVVESAPEPEEHSAGFHWPDPIDLASETPDKPVVKEDEVVVEKEEVTSLESPFLTDAKVEKRPLGTFSTSESPAVDLHSALNGEDTSELNETLVPDEATEADIDAIDFSALEVSEEALDELAESADTTPDTLPAPEEPTPLEEEAPQPEPTSYIPEEPETPLLSASISQQYKEQPSTTEQPSGAIYDTEAYHQPLAHPQKKKSGIFIVLWILGLIVIGGGLGAALYFFVLPLL